MPVFKNSNYTISEEELKKIENSQKKFKKNNYLFSDKELLKIKHLYINGYKYKEIAKKFNCHQCTIEKIIKDKSII